MHQVLGGQPSVGGRALLPARAALWGVTLLEPARELGMLPEPVAIAPDVHDVTVMDQAIDQCGGHDLVAEYLAPLLEAFIARQDGGGVFVAAREQLEKEHRPGFRDGEV